MGHYMGFTMLHALSAYGQIGLGVLVFILLFRVFGCIMGWWTTIMPELEEGEIPPPIGDLSPAGLFAVIVASCIIAWPLVVYKFLFGNEE